MAKFLMLITEFKDKEIANIVKEVVEKKLQDTIDNE